MKLALAGAALAAALAAEPSRAADRLAAEKVVRIDATVEGDLAAAGRHVVIAAPVQGYALAAGRRVEVSGPVADDVWAAGETVTLDAEVGDNARLAAREVRVTRNARVNGDLLVFSSQPPQISPEAQVLGEVRYTAPREGRSVLGWLGSWLYWFLALLIVGFAALWLLPAWAARVTRAMREKPGATLLTGAAALVATPLAVMLLAGTVIGIPLALVLLAAYVTAIVLAGALVAYRLGGWMLSPKASRPWARMALGAAIVAFVVSLPWIGWAAQVAVLVAGLGGLVLERWAAARQPA